MDIREFRKPENEVNPLFINRWSPRAFTGEPIPDVILMSCFEAARWAPSSGNSQPWRFLYAKRGSLHWAMFLDLLVEGNRIWADKASALIVIASKKSNIREGKEQLLRTHSYDTGAAWENFALQATHLNWHAHGMGGFDYDKAQAILQIPSGFAVEAMAAIGRLADKSILPEKLREREVPSSRQPLHEMVIEGGFKT
jgi:nitroreductase